MVLNVAQGMGGHDKRPGSPRKGLHLGMPVFVAFLRTAKLGAVGMEAMTAHFDFCGNQPIEERDRAAAGSIAQRPIAPGKVTCPLPPWDTAFPGAFFFAHNVARRSGYAGALRR